MDEIAKNGLGAQMQTAHRVAVSEYYPRDFVKKGLLVLVVLAFEQEQLTVVAGEYLKEAVD